jgi:hypothetical protein
MYSTVLLVHSWLRWLVLLLGLLALLRPPQRSDRDRSGLLFTIALDVQFLAGVLLYAALSPLTRAAFHSMSAVMQHAQLRYWVVEHPFGMLVALALGHLARAKPRWRTVFILLALIILAALLPWPGLPYGRPLFRMTG